VQTLNPTLGTPRMNKRRYTISVVALDVLLLLFLLSLMSSMPGTVFGTESESMSIYFIPGPALYPAVLINDRSVVGVYSDNGVNFVALLNIPQQLQFSVNSSWTRYVIQGSPQHIAKSASMNATFVAVVTDMETLIISTANPLSPLYMRFHGSSPYRAEISENGVATLGLDTPLGRMIRILKNGSESWCDISSVYLGNATYSVVADPVDFRLVSEARGSDVIYSSNLAVAYKEVEVATPQTVLLDIKPYIYNETTGTIIFVTEGVAVVTYSITVEANTTSVTKIARIGVKVSVPRFNLSSDIQVEVFYLDPSNKIFYGKSTVPMDLIATTAENVIPVLVPLGEVLYSGHIPRPVEAVQIKIMNIVDPSLCPQTFVAAPIVLSVETPDISSFKLLHVLNISSNILFVYSYVDNQGYYKLVFNLTSSSGYNTTERVLESRIVASAISADGAVSAVALSNGILYVFVRQSDGRYLLVDSYRLSSLPTTVHVSSGAGRTGDKYVISVGMENGDVLFLVYSRGGGVKPLNRFNEVALNVGWSPARLDASGSMSQVLISTPAAFLYSTALNNFIDTPGIDLSRYVARRIVFRVGPAEANITLSGSAYISVPTRGGQAAVSNLGIGDYSIVIRPEDKYMPALSMNVSIGAEKITLTLSLKDQNLDVVLPLDVNVTRPEGEMLTQISGSTNPALQLNYGYTYIINIVPGPMDINGEFISVYSNTTLIVDLTRRFELSVNAQIGGRRLSNVTLCVFTEDGKPLGNVLVDIYGASSSLNATLQIDRSGCASRILPYDLYTASIRALPEFIENPGLVRLVVSQPLVLKSMELKYRPFNVSVYLLDAVHVDVVVRIGDAIGVIPRGERSAVLTIPRPGNYTLSVEPRSLHIGGVTASAFRFSVSTVLIPGPTEIPIDVQRGVARSLTVCIRTPDGRLITDTEPIIVGATLNNTIKLNLDNATNCFIALAVPYDIYLLDFTKPSSYVVLERIYIAVDQEDAVIDLSFRYKPVGLIIRFVEPPKVDLVIRVGQLYINVSKGSREVLISDVIPGTYDVEITPIPEIPQMQARDVSLVGYYSKERLRLQLFELINVVDVSLEPGYVNVSLVLEDKTVGGSPQDFLTVLINGTKVGMVEPNVGRVWILVPRTTFTLRITSPIYSDYEITASGDSINGSITVRLSRRLIPVRLVVRSNLGEDLNNAVIRATCGNHVSHALSINGVAELSLPTKCTCIIEAELAGYEKSAQSVFVEPGVAPQLTLKATIPTIILKYISIIVAVIVLAFIGGLVLYMRRRIFEALEKGMEEFI